MTERTATPRQGGSTVGKPANLTLEYTDAEVTAVLAWLDENGHDA
jgi:hypothetical protein